VHELAGRYYSSAQRVAWAPEVMSTDDMLDRLRGELVFIAEDQQGVAGFMSLRLPDELDFAYVRPDCAGKGVAGLLHDTLIDTARQSGVSGLSTCASELARSFFAKRGWTLQERRNFEHNGVLIHNYRMTLSL
jgi:putative acetyltransferase